MICEFPWSLYEFMLTNCACISGWQCKLKLDRLAIQTTDALTLNVASFLNRNHFKNWFLVCSYSGTDLTTWIGVMYTDKHLKALPCNFVQRLNVGTFARQHQCISFSILKTDQPKI